MTGRFCRRAGWRCANALLSCQGWKLRLSRAHPQARSPGRRCASRTPHGGPGSRSSKPFRRVMPQTCTLHCCPLQYTLCSLQYALLAARHKHDSFKIEKIIAENSISKNYAGVNSSRNLSSANKIFKKKECCALLL